MPDFSDILFLSDFDLTLTDGQNIPAANLEAIEYFKQNGGLFGVASGRAKQTFAPQLERLSLNAPCVFSNGAMIYDFAQERTLAAHPLSGAEKAAVAELLGRYGMNADREPEVALEVYCADGIYAASVNEFTRAHFDWVKLTSELRPLGEIPSDWLKTILTADPARVPSLEAEARALGLNAVSSLPFIVEIQASGVNKGGSARELARMLGRTLVCAGDAPNDLALLREADRAFVPENAYPEVLALGFERVCHCKDGAVADVIMRLARERK